MRTASPSIRAEGRTRGIAPSVAEHERRGRASPHVRRRSRRRRNRGSGANKRSREAEPQKEWRRRGIDETWPKREAGSEVEEVEPKRNRRKVAEERSREVKLRKWSRRGIDERWPKREAAK